MMIKLLCKKLPLIWTINNSFIFIRSIISILISVMGEVIQNIKIFFFLNTYTNLYLKISSGAIDIAQENLGILINICLTKISQPSALSQEEKVSHQKLIELQQKNLNDIIKDLIRQVSFIFCWVLHIYIYMN